MPLQEGLYRREFIVGSLLLLGGSLTLEACLKTHRKALSAVGVDSEEPELKKLGFDFETYAPPPEGVIIERSFKPGNKRTVLYLPNKHPTSSLGNIFDISIDEVQRQLFIIVADLIEKGLKIPLVLEGEPEDLTPEKIMRKFDSMLSFPPDSFMLWDNGLYKLLTLLRSQKQGSNKGQMAREFMQKWIVKSGPALLATFPDEIIPIGSTGPDDKIKEDQLMAKLVAWNKKLDDSASKCPNVPLRFSEASKRFFKGSKNKKVVDCYCGVRHDSTQLKAEMVQQRQINASTREMEMALEYPGPEECVVVIAGLNHLAEAARILRTQKNVNYLVVAPKALESPARQGLTNPIDIGLNFPDSKDGTCAQWEKKENF